MFFKKRKTTYNQPRRDNVLCLNPNPLEVYAVFKHFAGDDPDEKRRLVAAKLEIALDADDWYKFQDQEFYPDLIQYLDNLKIQVRDRYLGMDSSL